MATQVDSHSDQGVTTLVGGIVKDARELFVEQMTLFQVEVKNELKRNMEGLIPQVIGLGVVLIGLGLAGAGLAYLLNQSISGMNLWLALFLVGCGFGIVGGSLIYWGNSLLNKCNLTPDTALKGLKENIQWKTKS